MYAEVIVKFKIDPLCTFEELDEIIKDDPFFENREDFIRYLIKEESLFGLAGDKHEIMSIKMKENEDK